MPKNRNVVFKTKSKYQRIELRRDRGHLLLKLNGSPQVHTKEERKYHETFAALPMMLAKNISRVVILGGGDGLAAREVLKFAKVKSVTLIELDRKVVDLCKNSAEWRAISNDALNDPRLKVVTGDAIAWMLRTNEKFDVIIHDIEDQFTAQPKPLTLKLYYRFYRALFEKLNPGGIWVTTIDDENDAMLHEMFRFYRDTIPQETQQRFLRKRSYIGKNRVLFQVLFPHVRQLTIKFPILGNHTHFYMSKSPISKICRIPSEKLPHLNKRLIAKFFAEEVH